MITQKQVQYNGPFKTLISIDRKRTIQFLLNIVVEVLKVIKTFQNAFPNFESRYNFQNKYIKIKYFLKKHLT